MSSKITLKQRVWEAVQAYPGSDFRVIESALKATYVHKLDITSQTVTSLLSALERDGVITSTKSEEKGKLKIYTVVGESYDHAKTIAKPVVLKPTKEVAKFPSEEEEGEDFFNHSPQQIMVELVSKYSIRQLVGTMVLIKEKLDEIMDYKFPRHIVHEDTLKHLVGLMMEDVDLNSEEPSQE